MTKKRAHLLLVFLDLFCLLGIWWGCREVKEVISGIAHSVDIVSFSNRVGFYMMGTAMPLSHLFVIYEHFRPDIVAKKKTFFNRPFEFNNMQMYLFQVSLLGCYALFVLQ